MPAGSRRAPHLDGISRILFRKQSLRRQPFLFPKLAPGEPLARLRAPGRLRLIPGSFRLSPAARRPAPCSVLHRRRFFVPRFLRTGRWALTPPFHPYPMTHEASPGGLFSVTLSVAQGFRLGRPRLLRGLLPVWCPDFPLAGRTRSGCRPSAGKVAWFRRMARVDPPRFKGSRN